MKKIVLLASLAFSTVVYSQVKVQNIPENSIVGQNPFFDASGYTKNTDKSLGRGLYFPQTDLTQWVFKTQMVSRSNFTTAFDGMVVYNTATGTVNADGTQTSTKGQTVQVTPGFYYFFNPKGKNTRTVNEGVWTRLGDAGQSQLILTQGTGTQSPAVETNTTIDAKKVFAVKGSFTLPFNNSNIYTEVALPEGFKTLYAVKFYKKDGTSVAAVGSTLYSYEVSGTNLRLTFGQGGTMSITYPTGDYEYVLEYMK